MVNFYFKDFGIILCALYCSKKIIGFKDERKKKMISFIFSIILALLCIFVDLYFAYFTFYFILISVYLYSLVFLKILEINHILKIIVSYAISIIVFQISVIISSIIVYSLLLDYYERFGQIVVFIIQIILIRIMFLFDGIKKGMPFLQRQIYLIPCVIISILIITVASVLNANDFSFSWIFVYLVAFVLIFMIYIYWRNAIKRAYIERTNIRDIDTFINKLSEAYIRIDELKEDNNRIGHILHRDKKLVSAMENDVESFMNEILAYLDEPAISEKLDDSQREEISNLKERGSKLIDDLREMAKGREGMITLQERSVEKLPKTNVSSLDRLFNYMQSRAYDNDISFHLSIGSDINDIGELFEKTISDDDLCTLLADLIDNAIVATKYNGGKQIMVNISRVSEERTSIIDRMKYNPKDIAIHIFDSGVPFTKEVLMSYGLEEITTHKDDGGNGKGLMKTYEILSKCGASLFIQEFDSNNGFYTKEITVVFNRKHQYLIYTGRSDEEISYIRKRADVMVIKR